MRTISVVNKAIIGQLESALGRALPIFPKAFIRVLSKMLAGVFILIDKYIGFSLLQLFVTTATWEEIDVDGNPVRPLVLWGNTLGVDPPVDGIKASLLSGVTVSVSGATVPTGAQLIHRPTGNLYLCTANIVLFTPVTAIPVQSTVPGDDYNLDNGSILEFIETPTGAEKRTEVALTTVTGVDGETEEEYRARVLARPKSVPEGGAPGHYRKWAIEAGEEEITKAYPYLSSFASLVYIYIDTEDGTTPTAPQIATVQSYVDTKIPAGDSVTVYAVSRTAFIVTVSNLVPTSPANQAQTEDEVETAIENYFANREPFIQNVSVLPRKDIISTGEVFGLASRAASGVNAYFSALNVAQGGAPVTLYTLGDGERATVTVVFA